MSMASLEKEIWIELKEVTGNRKIRVKDILEWRTTEFEGCDDEKIIFLRRGVR